MSDAVDEIIGLWTRERPDLADMLWPIEVLARVQRISRVLERDWKAFAAQYGLELGELDVLTTLKRSGPRTR
ncbi:hypothetical protein [Streptomyces sp. MST-110588]|uniref:hypothetical protein n=1 Tax=Streptomyces sp. MST-110588 TaxID=2833628 RepID=UPI003241CAB1